MAALSRSTTPVHYMAGDLSARMIILVAYGSLRWFRESRGFFRERKFDPRNRIIVPPTRPNPNAWTRHTTFFRVPPKFFLLFIDTLTHHQPSFHSFVPILFECERQDLWCVSIIALFGCLLALEWRTLTIVWMQPLSCRRQLCVLENRLSLALLGRREEQ